MALQTKPIFLQESNYTINCNLTINWRETKQELRMRCCPRGMAAAWVLAGLEASPGLGSLGSPHD